MKKILIIDDEWNMRNLIRIYLHGDYQIMEAEDGLKALALISAGHFDLIILDIMLPTLDGWEICKEIRKEKDIPILMLTARNELRDKIYGLDIGADDYLEKPFEPEELVARIKALLRRSVINKNHTENVLMFGDHLMIIKPKSRTVLVKGKKIDFTPKEYDLLHLLATQPQLVFTRELLLDAIWGIKDVRDTRTVDSHVKNIRTKIKEKTPTYNPIETIWGVGYKFNAAADGEL
ncbi:response regulator transcription factor [Bacillus sp. V5-8f]|uniref:response regulator transcription factor n=1 Tax=Bacillus sp. V5-8f TaxID=2053044 RepID=UPI000C7834E6|nr:response regulator transcription factor [Bacillus sp. V5-8f]PLT32499.1 DNA-binding response regulator [Bacillus sp. V5-8f]